MADTSTYANFASPPPALSVITGPTGVGKTAIAVEVAEKLGAEIVSADSMQVYRRMEAGTAKPSAEERARVPHHLVDVADPTEPFTVALYRPLAVAAIEAICAHGRLPLLVGGTRLYIKALTAPFSGGPPPDPAFRATLAGLPSKELHRQLAESDSTTAARLHPQDRKRIIRALEVALSGGSIAAVQAASQEQGALYSAKMIVLARPREELYARSDARVDEMIAGGLVEEVRAFLDEGLTAETPAMQAHGYKEIVPAVTGECSLAEAVAIMKRNTRHYIKYQLGWLRQEPDAVWVDATQPVEAVVEQVVTAVHAAESEAYAASSQRDARSADVSPAQ